MDVFFLGAGQSAFGEKPAALKHISLNQKALDWQLNSLSRLAEYKVHFIGGYHVDEVMVQYPQLHYTVVPDWKTNNVIHTLLMAPIESSKSAILLYSDTLFRPKMLKEFAKSDADLTIGIDSQWLQRFENRSKEDIADSEVLDLASLVNGQGEVEFTGLLKLSVVAIGLLAKVNSNKITTLVDLIYFLKSEGLSVAIFDVKGDWAEFNSELDIARFVLGTKSETLYRLYSLVKNAVIGQQVSFTVDQWQSSQNDLLNKIQTRFAGKHLVVRSSSFAEDCWDESHAGGFESVLNVDSKSKEEVCKAVDDVVASYKGSETLASDQVLVQEFLSEVQMSGVVFTRSLETGAPYYRINFDDKTNSTESVTSGMGTQLRTLLINKAANENNENIPHEIKKVLAGVKEIEGLLNYDKLDIEFAIDGSGVLHIFQVRPISVNHLKYDIDDDEIISSITFAAAQFKCEQVKKPHVRGKSAYFGVMPDWNPAEIIGIRPKPLSYSLYRHLIVDETWAIQRAEFGYHDVSSYPLIRLFSGQPYVNIQNSLNSFVPSSVSEESAERIVNAYLAILKNNPQFHDKLEFDVAFTVLSPAFDSRVSERLRPFGVTSEDIVQLRSGLHQLTEQAFVRLEKDIYSVQKLEKNRCQIVESNLDSLSKVLLLLDDCKKHGTLAFSHAARAGFVAMSFINDFVQLGVISQQEKEQFLSSFSTVAGEFEQDAERVAKGELTKEAYKNSYGHLRPGTYDITAKAYWENPQRYLYSKIGNVSKSEGHKLDPFVFNSQSKAKISKALKSLNLSVSVNELINYWIKATQAREFVKFEFSKNLSVALDLIRSFGKSLGIKRKSLAFLSLDDLRCFSLGVTSVNDLKKIISRNKKKFIQTKMIELPQLITKQADFWGFERNASEPNFVTSKSIEAESTSNINCVDDIRGKVVFIEQADPGYDWMFAYDLAGLITKYGGANSHMAIRSAELNLPAAIGVGDKLYEALFQSERIRMNCALKQIIKIK